jgi:hypothetical protein
VSHEDEAVLEVSDDSRGSVVQDLLYIFIDPCDYMPENLSSMIGRGSGKFCHLFKGKFTVMKMLPAWAMESIKTDCVKLGVSPDMPVI